MSDIIESIRKTCRQVIAGIKFTVITIASVYVALMIIGLTIRHTGGFL